MGEDISDVIKLIPLLDNSNNIDPRGYVVRDLINAQAARIVELEKELERLSSAKTGNDKNNLSNIEYWENKCAELEAATVEVKPLEWDDDFAKTPWGGYSLGERVSMSGDWMWGWSHTSRGDWDESDNLFETVEEAVSDAQADYERRILSALQSAAKPQGYNVHDFAATLRDHWRKQGLERMNSYLRNVSEGGTVIPSAPVTVQQAAKVLLAFHEAGRDEVYKACRNRVKVYKFDSVLRALSSPDKGGVSDGSLLMSGSIRTIQIGTAQQIQGVLIWKTPSTGRACVRVDGVDFIGKLIPAIRSRS